MIQGLGTDIIAIKRIEDAIEKHGMRFLQRIFTDKELEYCQQFAHPIPHFAGRFAAKEAVLKAISTDLDLITWKDMEILKDDQGKPTVHLHGGLKKKYGSSHFLVTISHCQEYATATAILIGDECGA